LVNGGKEYAQDTFLGGFWLDVIKWLRKYVLHRFLALLENIPVDGWQYGSLGLIGYRTYDSQWQVIHRTPDRCDILIFFTFLISGAVIALRKQLQGFFLSHFSNYNCCQALLKYKLSVSNCKYQSSTSRLWYKLGD